MDFTELTSADLADAVEPRHVLSAETVYTGRIWDVRAEQFELSDGGPRMTRDFITHPGAVTVVALDDQDRVHLIRQYRHPVGMTQWEIPAGILDVEGERPEVTARRELAEEADLEADELWVLADFHNSPGSSAESIRVFLARGLHPVPEGQRHERSDEESEIIGARVALDDVVAAILAGRVSSPNLVVGALAAHAARAAEWTTLRDPSVPWPAHPELRHTGGVVARSIIPLDQR
ncbi:NUDIX domain-containing protein [Kocuria sp.]|uniref:NUDIX domain-containing protein n=1 Tax=Kocuria sp. TaxID=1871328 RepID=UPI0026DF03E8|nr:NUDIX hydrolase [Kocuria sp.]MDO5619491.1 NUDIX hydrolase [Kocuria sp.]